MKRSTDRILTTHVGSLARPTELLDTMKEKENDRPYDAALFDRQVRDVVADRVQHQVDAGIDIVTDGEQSKSSFLGYVKDRLGGFEVDTGASSLAPSWQKEFDDFPDYYTDYFKKYSSAVAPLRRIICTGPITYVGQELLQKDIDNLKAAVEGKDVTEVFMPATGPSGFGRNAYYDTYEEYLHHVAEAMREEYLGIVGAGFVLQVDDPWLIDTLSDPTKEEAERRRAATVHVEALNHVLRDIPTDRIRHHTCYGLNHGPRMNDIPLATALEYTLQIDAGAYSFEVANPRHMHEWRIWETTKLPDGKILIPGLLGHANNYVEHPDLIAEYIVKYANLVGKENIIAGADCGFSSRASYAPEVHPTVVWPKFEALAEGAAIATKELWVNLRPWGSISGGLTMTSTASDEVVFPEPGEIDGFWALDKMHAPRPVTPLSFDLVVRTLSQGFTAAQAEYDCPMMASSREINHYFYMAFHPIPDEAELQDRMTRYHHQLATKVPGVGKRWEEEWKPEVRALNEAERSADYEDLSDTELVAKLDELTDRMRHQWWIHGHINFVLLSSSAFCDLYDEVMQPSESTEAYQTLQGFHTRSVDVSRGLWELSRKVKASPALSEAFRTLPTDQLLAALDETDEGRALRADVDAFLFEFGWRHDAVYDLADVPWREDPTIPLASIAGFLDLDDDQDPEVLYRKSVATRERLLSTMRERLADDPETLAKLDHLYEAAQYSFPLTEDHAFYIDQLGVSVFRRFVLAIGDRLVAKGLLEAPDDVFYLYRDEVVDALTNGGDRREVAGARRASMARAAQVVPPGVLGTPPPPPAEADPFMDALVFRLLGVVPPEENLDPNVLKAVAGSPGAYTGTARVVRSLAEGMDLQDGEVLVCEMTLPPWVPLFSIAGAVVSDVGGVLSHCAIVAREFEIPAVVGTQVGTTTITTGQTITVDGNKGIVYLDGRTV